jgi:hypothetical protein
MRHLFLTILFLNFTTMLFSQSKADDIIGVWYSPIKEGNVQIFKSGNKYYGKIVYLKNSVDKEGNPVLDVNNPDKKNEKCLWSEFFY